jgi:ABC-type sulfate transport system permease subunit
LIAGLSVVVVIVLLVASSVLGAFSKGVGAFLPNCADPNRLSSLRLP